jgi:hypothetical protein
VFKIDIETKPGLRRGDAHHRLHRGCGNPHAIALSILADGIIAMTCTARW